MSATCEWNPTQDRPAFVGEDHAEATVSLGADGVWHLCDACAALPKFKRFTVRKPLRKGAPDAR